jgi:hypothetical protein
MLTRTQYFFYSHGGESGAPEESGESEGKVIEIQVFISFF